MPRAADSSWNFCRRFNQFLKQNKKNSNSAPKALEIDINHHRFELKHVQTSNGNEIDSIKLRRWNKSTRN